LLVAVPLVGPYNLQYKIPSALSKVDAVRPKRGVMAMLNIDFQEGFTGDTVNVRVNGHTALHQEGVSTKRMLGLASSSQIDVPDGTVKVEISVPTKNISKVISLKSSDSPHLGVSINEGKIEHILSEEPFGYA
jgi:hypothetical protein